MGRIALFIQEGVSLLGKKHFTLSQRLGLLVAYMRIAARRFVRARFGLKGPNQRRILGFTIKLDKFRPDFYWIFREIFLDESYYFLTRKTAPVIVDCGSNIGISVLYFKALYPSSKILAFEPHPENASLLRLNLQKNGITGVEVREVALGGKDGEIEISTQGPGSTVHLEFAKKQKPFGAQGDSVSVPVHRLSTYLNESVDFLKLDVEGAEADILEDLGVSGKLAGVSRMAMEYHNFSTASNRLSVIASTLERNNFEYLAAGEARNMSSAPKSAYRTFMLFAQKLEPLE